MYSGGYPTRPNTNIRPMVDKHTNNSNTYNKNPYIQNTKLSISTSSSSMSTSTVSLKGEVPKLSLKDTNNTNFKFTSIEELKTSFLNPDSNIQNNNPKTEEHNLKESLEKVPFFNGVIEWCLEYELPNWLINNCYVDERGNIVIYKLNDSATTNATSLKTMGYGTADIISRNSEPLKEILLQHIQNYDLRVINNSINECPIISLTPSLEVANEKSSGTILFRFGDDRTSFKKLFTCLTYWGNMKPCSVMAKSEILDFNHEKKDDFKNENNVLEINGIDSFLEFEKTTIISPTKTKMNEILSLNEENRFKWKNSHITLLKDKGELKIEFSNDRMESKTQLIDLSLFLSSEIYILDPSICKNIDDSIVVIKPLNKLRKLHNLTLLDQDSVPSAVYLRFPLRIDLECWFAYLTSFTKPEVLRLFGSDNSNDIKLSSELNISVFEADLQLGSSSYTSTFYVEVLVWDEVFGRTSKVTSTTASPFWRDEFKFKFNNKIDQMVFKIKQTNGVEIGHVFVSRQMLFDTQYLDKEIRLSIISSKTNKQNHIGNLLCKIENKWNFVLPSENFNNFNSILKNIDLKQIVKILYSNKLNQDQQFKCSSILLDIFTTLKREPEYLQLLVEREIDDVIQLLLMKKNQNSDSTLKDSSTQHIYNSLFRGNSNLTKVVEYYFHTIGMEYLTLVLKPIIVEIIEKNIDCEIDPSKIKNRRPTPVQTLSEIKSQTSAHENGSKVDDDDKDEINNEDENKNIPDHLKSTNDIITERYEILFQYINRIWNAIYKTSNDLPPAMKEQLKVLRNNLQLFSVQGLDEEQVDTLVLNCTSSFLFLRFFCPVLLSPKLFNIVQDHPNETSRRTLTLLSKMLLNFSTLTMFGVKEPFLTKFNDFTNEHKAEILEYTDKVSDKKIDFNPKTLALSWMKPLDFTSNSNLISTLSVPHLLDIYLGETELIDILLKSYFDESDKVEPVIVYERDQDPSVLNDFNHNFESSSEAIKQTNNIVGIGNLNIQANDSEVFKIGELEFESLSDNNTHVFGQDMMDLLEIETDQSKKQSVTPLTKSSSDTDYILKEFQDECNVLYSKKNRLLGLFSDYEYIKSDSVNFVQYVTTHLYMDETTKAIRTLKDYENTVGYKKLFNTFPSMENIFGKFALYGIKSMSVSPNRNQPRSSYGFNIPSSSSSSPKFFTTGTVNDSSSKNTINPNFKSNKISRSISRFFKRKD